MSRILFVALILAAVLIISGCTSPQESQTSGVRHVKINETTHIAAPKRVPERVSPISTFLGIELGKTTYNVGGTYKSGKTGGMPESIRVPFWPQRALPQFRDYWYYCSIKSHRVFMIGAKVSGEVKADSLLAESVFNSFVKSLERKYRQTAKQEGADSRNVRYTFQFPGGHRLVVHREVGFTQDETVPLGAFGGVVPVLGAILNEASGASNSRYEGFVSIIAYDVNAMNVAKEEERGRKEELRLKAAAELEAREKKSAAAAQAISDAL